MIDKILVYKETQNAFKNMAEDEMFLTKKTDNKTAILRFYAWKPKAISIGYFQAIKEEVNTKKCKKEKIDIVRRITGGGAVFHDKEITYSFICPKKEVPSNIIESYKKICLPIIKALKDTGIKAEFTPLNDITVNRRKISGNAQTRKNNKVLQHGTILLTTNPEKMFSLLKIPNEKIKDKMIKHAKERVIGIKEINKNIKKREIQKKIEKNFSREFKAKTIQKKLSSREKREIQKIEKKYKSKKWNYFK